MAQNVLIIRQPSALRAITEQEALRALPPEHSGLPYREVVVHTAQFADNVAQGDWGGQDGQDLYLREAAGTIKATADELGDVTVHYFGLAEVPHIIALGAHVGNEREVISHDHHGESGPWQWPETSQTVKVKTLGTDDLKVVVKASGAAVIRVSITSAVTDEDVRAVVGDGTLADITITHAEVAPSRNLIRSLADVEAVRKEFIAAYGAMQSARPGIEVVHLFVAAPPSICFAVGQELVLRNNKPVQTYRYRSGEGNGPRQQPAILLSPVAEQNPMAPLTADEVQIAEHVRKDMWPIALNDIETYAANKIADGKLDGFWFDSFVHRDALRRAMPFPNLPALGSFVPRDVKVDPEPYPGEFAFEEAGRRWWRLSDRLLVGLYRAADGNDARLRQLIRLFLLHEYVHLFHSIGKFTALQVGKFANCLEHIDYTADTYALLHQLDIARQSDRSLHEFEPMKAFLVDQLELAIRSFWAFNGAEWQVRRIRRYMNWYWRQVQIENAKSAEAAMMLFARQPRVELGGLYQVARGPRVMAFLDRLDATADLELGIVMEDEKLFRLSKSPNTNLVELLAAFRRGDHKEIQKFFRAVYSTAQGYGSAVQPIVRN